MNIITIVKSKRPAFISLALILLTILILSASISNLELEKGSSQTVGSEESLLQPLTPFNKFSTSELNRIIATILDAAMILVFWILVPLSLIVYFFSRGSKLKKLRNISLAIIAFLIIPFIMQRLMAQIEPIPLDGVPMAVPSALPAAETSPPPFQEPSDNVVFWVSTLAIAATIGIGLMMWRRHTLAQTPVIKLRQEAEGAILAIRDGSKLKDTVLRCYFQMIRIVQETRGYKRDESMTPREFESDLIEFGLPVDRVQQLTRLFERVRYGDSITQSKDEEEALGCLAAIVEACSGA